MTQNQKKTRKSTTRKKTRKSKAKKGKAYIPAYKIIISCAIIITICMGLLLYTTIAAQAPEKKESISSEFVEKTESKKPDKKPEEKKSVEKKSAEKKEKEKQIESKKSDTSDTKVEKNKTESKKESPKKENVKKETAKKESPEKKTPSESTSQSENSKVPEPAPIPKPTPAPAPSKTVSKYNFPMAKNNAQLVFVFDDGGQNLNHLKSFLKLPFPITVAVLPQLAHSKEAAAQIRASGNEVILHQPMQSIKASVNPGPGAIKPEMTEDQIISTLFQNITEIAPIAGMNNHEGSGITADAEKMATVMRVCSQEGIYFLDSRTNSETKVPYVAEALGYSYYERNIFLDNEKTDENALKELKKGLDIANRNGSVIMIGHIWSADFLPAFLLDVYPELKERGYTFSLVSKSKAKKN